MDLGVSQARKHRPDVAGEGRVGSDNQDFCRRKLGLMVEQQPGNPMERYSRLARSGASLNHEDPVQRAADELVLSRMDRLDDVLHFAGTIGLEVPQNCVVDAPLLWPGEPFHPLGQVGKQGVVEPEDGVAIGRELALELHAHGFGDGGDVEGLSRLCFPVDDQQVSLVGRDHVVPDVERGPVDVEPSEGNRLVGSTELVRLEVRRLAHRSRALVRTSSRACGCLQVRPLALTRFPGEVEVPLLPG